MEEDIGLKVGDTLWVDSGSMEDGRECFHGGRIIVREIEKNRGFDPDPIKAGGHFREYLVRGGPTRDVWGWGRNSKMESLQEFLKAKWGVRDAHVCLVEDGHWTCEVVESFCSKSKDGKHAIDPDSIVLEYARTVIVHLSCVHCEQVGSFGFAFRDVNW